MSALHEPCRAAEIGHPPQRAPGPAPEAHVLQPALAMRARRGSATSITLPAWPGAALLCALAAGGVLARPSCKDVSAGQLSFGAYDPLSSAPADASSVITYSCSNSIRVAVSLSGDGGGHSSPRTLNGPGGNHLLYDLYTSAARDVIWGDGSGGTVTLNVDPNGHSVTVYGRIFALQGAAAGGYSDTIVVTFNF
jgi:spore coat protein U-like protein